MLSHKKIRERKIARKASEIYDNRLFNKLAKTRRSSAGLHSIAEKMEKVKEMGKKEEITNKPILPEKNLPEEGLKTKEELSTILDKMENKTSKQKQKIIGEIDTKEELDEMLN